MRQIYGLGLAAIVAATCAIACGDSEGGINTTGSPTSGTAGSMNTGGMAGMGGASPTTGVAMGGMGGIGGNGTGGTPNYPAGPYGNNVGDTFPFFELEGYLSTNPLDLANLEVWTPTYTMSDLFTSGASYALVHTTLRS